jgi:serine/threonine protein kinase
MLPRTIEEFSSMITRLRLVTPAQIAECKAALTDRTSVDQLVNLLQGRKYLTSFQMARLRKGDTNGMVLGEYKLLYRNASGSFARVYRAESLINGQMVGLKLLRQRWASDPHAVETFHREAELIKRFQHKNIVPIYDVGSEHNYHFFTMEFVEGGNLRDFIKIRKTLNPDETCRCLRDICEGLAYALSMGATHRDMKLTNVLMSSNGVAKLVDFGLAGDLNDDGTYDDDGAGRALEYAALERGTGARYADPRTDLFFAGAIMYELLTGQPPWQRTRNREERKLISRYSQVKPVESIDPTIPREVVKIVNRLLFVNPSLRYQSANEAAADLRVVLGTDIAGKKTKLSESAATKDKPKQRTILCVENRKKQQDILREYFSGKDYRVLMVGDFDRAMTRIRQGQSPECVLLMAEPIGDRIIEAYRELRNLCESTKIAVSTVLSEKQGPKCKGEITQSNISRIFIQPISLTKVRLGLESSFESIASGKTGKGQSM